MSSAAETATAIVSSPDWNTRVARLRRVPEEFGMSQHAAIYSIVARDAYVPFLAPDFAYVHWTDDYELARVQDSYDQAYAATHGFMNVDEETLRVAVLASPRALRTFRLLLGLTWPELAASTALVSEDSALRPVGKDTVKAIESGRTPTAEQAAQLATVIHRAMSGTLFPVAAGQTRAKLQKPDTEAGWASVREFAEHGVPLPVLLHQRQYGGAFRQLLDATSTTRGDVLEEAVEQLVRDAGVPYLRTGSDDQAEIERRFGLTVRPAPDFVFHDGAGALRAMVECKVANDGGTARDKAARFRALRQEAMRLGGVPLFAVVAGLGWRRTTDALGPVIRDTDGRTFTLATLDEMLTVEPMPALRSSPSVGRSQPGR
jgi:hypothetical protein